MDIKRVTVGGNREQIEKLTGEHIPNLIDSVNRSDLIYTPDRLIRKLFKGDDEEYDSWLIENRLHPSQMRFHDINQKQEFIKSLKIYTAKLLNEAKINSSFYNGLGKFIFNKWLDTFDVLENHIYDLGDFDKIEFIKIVDSFKKYFDTSSPFAFLTIDEVNQQIKVVESHKTLFLTKEPLPMGNKRGTPVGEEPERVYQEFFTSIGYKGKGELTEGLNYHRKSFKKFNFNMNVEVRLLIDTIYNTLNYNREDMQIAFLFGAYGKKFYFESDIKGKVRTKEEHEALLIVEDRARYIGKELHRERQGSIGVNKTSMELKKRIQHPKEGNLTVESVDFEKEFSLSDTLEAFEKEIFSKQKAYAELAKEKINEALANREQYVAEFYSLLDKGMGISDALSKFSKRYANNPYIKGIIETTIAGELKVQHLKDRGIEELNSFVDKLKDKIEKLKANIDSKESEVASLNQKIEATIVSHTKQLEKIEVKIIKLLEDKDRVIKENKELKDLIDIQKISLEEKDREVEYYTKQIEQLKEENRLAISTTNLLRISNIELKEKLDKLKEMDK